MGGIVSNDRRSGHGPLGLFRLEVITKPDGRLLHLYTWPEPAPAGERVESREPDARGGDARAGPDAEEQPGV